MTGATKRRAPEHPWIALADTLEKQSAHYPVVVPDMKRGQWTVATRKLTRDALILTNLRYIRDGVPEAVASPGTYKILHHKTHGIVMSNTQFEYRTNKPFVDAACGRVLITGLGLGMILSPLAARDEVESITVIEHDADLIAMIAPFYDALPVPVDIILADAREWIPEEKFDCAFHDIWNGYGDEGHARERVKMRKHYARHVRGKQVAWVENICLRMERNGR